jgi:acyl carrier protein
VDIQVQLRECLLPVFGFNSIDQIPDDAALIKDLGADSLDFVEIVYLIERDFGVVLKTNELVSSGVSVPADTLFAQGRLTQEGAVLLKQQLPGSNGRFEAGMTKVELFQAITVRDLADIIKLRKEEKGPPC